MLHKINKYSLPYCNASLDMFICLPYKIMNSKHVRSTAIADVEIIFGILVTIVYSGRNV